MENQTILIATAGFAAAGIAGYMYLNKSDGVENENVKLGTTSVEDLKNEKEEESKTPWWNNFWGNQHKQQKVMEELKQQQSSGLYN